MAMAALANPVPAGWKARVVYALLALTVVAPLLKPGFVLTLDMAFTPELRMPDNLTSSYLFRTLLHVLSFVVPSQVLQKLLLFLVFFLAGIGMHRLMLALRKNADIYSTLGTYFGGLLYAINPFTYDRLMAGQYSVLLGYALLPFFVRSLLLFFQKPAARSAIYVAAWMISVSIVSIHTLGLVAVFVLTATIVMLRKKQLRQNIVHYGLLAAAIFVVASSYWLVPLCLGKGATATEIASFTASDNAAFATTGDNDLAKVAHVASLQGFWLEDRQLYVLPNDQVPGWPLFVAALWGIALFGVYVLWRQGQRTICIIFVISTLAGILLASGIFNASLMHLPLFAGYREPQKFDGLVALGLSLCAGVGVITVLRYAHQELQKNSTIFVGCILFLIPIILTSTIFWGARGQLSARQYPSGWAEANRQLNADRNDFQTLFLPWHLYMHFDFAGRTIINPAPDYFDKPVIVSDNPEFEGSKPPSSTSAQRQVGQLLIDNPEPAEFAKKLAGLDIKYITLARDNDFQEYTSLVQSPHFKLQYQSASIELYRNERWRE